MSFDGIALAMAIIGGFAFLGISICRAAETLKKAIQRPREQHHSEAAPLTEQEQRQAAKLEQETANFWSYDGREQQPIDQ